MSPTRTLATHVVEEERRGLARGLGGLLLDLASGVKAISAVLSRAVVCGAIGAIGEGDPQTRLDLLANDLLLSSCAAGGHVAAVASEELPEPRLVFGRQASPLLVALDALDGSSNLCVNVTVGTIFSVLPRPEGVPLGPAAFLQPGARQLCAGYALYGPSTMLVVTTGGAVNGFTLDTGAGEFVLTHPDLRIREARELAINPSTARHWDRPVRRYVDECVAGNAGPRGADFDMRWVGSVVPDVHRVLVRGGALVYPGDGAANGGANGGGGATLRLVYEASPVAMIAERAGGAASTGRGRVLDLVPRDLADRTPVVLGSPREVDRIVSYHADPDGARDRPYSSPLFNARSLLRET
jgi:fructose-1,6-bisphosphatase I/sedoheptulose-1,7-bisphosphatase/fructose-1,6-bisphosphatase I